MKAIFSTMSPFAVALGLVYLAPAQAAGSTDASAQARSSSQHERLLPESIGAAAARWGEELDRVAFALEERALAEAGGDALVQSLLARADHVRVRRARLRECAATRPSELARVLRRSVEDTPEAATTERELVSRAVERDTVAAARDAKLQDAVRMWRKELARVVSDLDRDADLLVANDDSGARPLARARELEAMRAQLASRARYLGIHVGTGRVKAAEIERLAALLAASLDGTPEASSVVAQATRVLVEVGAR